MVPKYAVCAVLVPTSVLVDKHMQHAEEAYESHSLAVHLLQTSSAWLCALFTSVHTGA